MTRSRFTSLCLWRCAALKDIPVTVSFCISEYFGCYLSPLNEQGHVYFWACVCNRSSGCCLPKQAVIAQCEFQIAWLTSRRPTRTLSLTRTHKHTISLFQFRTLTFPERVCHSINGYVLWPYQGCKSYQGTLKWSLAFGLQHYRRPL